MNSQIRLVAGWSSGHYQWWRARWVSYWISAGHCQWWIVRLVTGCSPSHYQWWRIIQYLKKKFKNWSNSGIIWITNLQKIKKMFCCHQCGILFQTNVYMNLLSKYFDALYQNIIRESSVWLILHLSAKRNNLGVGILILKGKLPPVLITYFKF